jgi:FecR protein
MRNRLELLRGLKGWGAGLTLVCLLFCGFAATARAYDTRAQRSARLSYLQGSVTVVRMDNTGSDTAQLNMPLAEGLRVMTGEDGQAEVEFEDGSLVRLTPNSSLSLDHLSADSGGNFQTQLSLVQGLVYAELRAASKYAYQLNVDGAVVSPVENATIRINLDEPPAVIAVLTGKAHVEHAGSQDSGGYRTDVRGGEMLTSDSSDAGRYFLSQQIAQDSWDDWNEERDQAAADEAASRTAARDSLEGNHGYGWSDLDANGSWYDVPGQGQVWQPTVAMDASFDPYGYGSWVWAPGSGYVWASGYSWGWTPFRCGNWSFWGGFGWGWAPGVNCGFGGWGFPGGVFVINVVRPPLGYHFLPLPVRGPGGVHPIVVVHPGRGPGMPVRPVQGARTIAGHTVEPLRPVGNGYTSRGGSAVGASLGRDFPMDRNHQPVIGRVGDHGSASGFNVGAAPVVRPGAEVHSDGWRPRGARAADGTPAPSGQPMRPAPPNSQRMDAIQGAHPAQGQQDQGRPAPRSNPPTQSFAPEVSRPAPPNPVARPIYPPSPQAPRSMAPPPMPRSMPSAPPPRPSPPPAPAAPRVAPSPK